MIALIKTFIAILLGAIISFGLWYLVGWFLSNESNLLIWSPVGKVLYLVFSFMSFGGMVDELTK